MAFTVFSRNKNDQLIEPMFFGQNVNVARYDQQKYEIFEKLTEKELSFFWRPEEIDVSQDRIDYGNLPEHEKHIFISNLKYQTLLDSLQGRGPCIALLPICSIPELENWIVTWDFMECVAEGTEYLTSTGWKNAKDVTTDDIVLVYDTLKNTTKWEKPKRVTSYDVENRLMVELVSSNNKQFHQLVTPNHRMPVYNRISGNQPANFRFVEAGLHFYQPHHLAPVSGAVETDSDPLQIWERILIAAQADGTWQPYRYTGERAKTIPIWFCFSKERKIKRLTMLCQMADIEIIELTGDKTDRGNALPQRRFKVNFPIEYLEEGFDLKDFSTWVKLDQISYDYCLNFIEELQYWDSHVFNRENGSVSIAYTSINKNNTDHIQAICAMCNKHARYRKRIDDRKATYSDTHHLNIVNRPFKDGQSIRKNLIPYTGKVYCIETSTGAFIMRYNGVVSVTGNTIHSRSYTHIIRNIVNDPSIVFDDVVENPEIQKRAVDMAFYYDDLILESQLYQTHGTGTWYRKLEDGTVTTTKKRDDLLSSDDWKEITLRELKKKLYLCLQSINALEAIRFYVSFASKGAVH